ncbi:GPW/gp25 family protein [Streptomyces sp. NPDC048172]|uniref:GPW/gp25 family protein n=1 Tax=Streptomyces sp. NPDC048172 TaxID=3365505 RepID=UPI003711065B
MTTLRGMSMPFRIEGGRVRQSAGADKVAEDLRHLLSTRLGERLLRRTYGGGVQHRLQQPNDHTLRTLIRHEIEQALRNHLPLARLTSPVRLSHSESELTVTFDYVIDSHELAQRVALTLPRPT